MAEKIKHVEFELTYTCNLRCLHCLNPTHSKTQELSTDKIKEIARGIKNAGIDEIHFNGGEPLMRKDIYEIVEHSANIGLKVILETNAVLLTDPKRFANKGEISVRASVDGPEVIHNEIRVSNNKAINPFIKTMQNLSSARKLGIPVQITCSVNKLNHNSIYTMVEQIIGYGINDIRLRLTVPSGFAIENWGRLGGMNKNDISNLENLSKKIRMDFPDITFNYQSINRETPGSESRITINPYGKVKYYKFIDFFVGDLRSETIGEVLTRLETVSLPVGSEKGISDYLSGLGMTRGI